MYPDGYNYIYRYYMRRSGEALKNYETKRRTTTTNKKTMSRELKEGDTILGGTNLGGHTIETKSVVKDGKVVMTEATIHANEWGDAMDFKVIGVLGNESTFYFNKGIGNR